MSYKQKVFEHGTIIKIGSKRIAKNKVAFIKHVGDYSKMDTEYGMLISQLYNWASSKITGELSSMIPLIIHHDDPTVTSPDKQRTSVCITLPKEKEVKAEGEIGTMEIDGGKYLVARFFLKPEEI